jgi:hypothetical protein
MNLNFHSCHGRRIWVAFCLGVVSAFWAPLCHQQLSASEPNSLSFDRDIRPLLSDTCFQCHGPDEAKRHGALRLDRRESAIGAGESGAIAIVPGDVDRSELNRRIISEDPAIVMPPPESGKTLTREQIELMRRWIADGANYEDHWSFRPIVRPAVPDGTGFAHPIDAFVEAKRKINGLSASPEADRVTLIRRLSLDLHGLLPSPQEVDQFVSDTSENAYEKLVDRLLASPRYGERLAVQWLDFARFADSNGFQVDSSRYQWPWRDWVIQSFNNNMPFNQFTIEQNAGDLLPNASTSQQLATGFHRNHKLNGEGGIISEEWRVETVIDRVETMGLTWLGLTFNCCRCHDHKYDPISQKEFYQLFAYYNNVPESGTLQGESRNTDPTITIISPENEARVKELESNIGTKEAELNDSRSKVRELASSWSIEFAKQLGDSKPLWEGLAKGEAKSLKGAKLDYQADGSLLASGENPANDVYEVTVPATPGKFSALLLECFTDPSLPQQSLGRFNNGNFVLSRVELVISDEAGKVQELKIAKAEADYSQSNWDISNVATPTAGKGWAVDGPTRKQTCKAVFFLDQPAAIPEKSKLTVRLHHEALSQHNIGRFRLSTTSAAAELVKLDQTPLPPALLEALKVPVEQRGDAQWKEIETYYASRSDSAISSKLREVEVAKKALQDYRQSLPSAMVLKEGNPRNAFILKRGQYDQPGDKVERGLPAFLPPLPTGSSNDRLGLANWLVDPANPLTSRVWVNRAWERFFGNGIVKTSENFGSQSEFPTHPELLDFLSAEFMQPSVLLAVNGEAPHAWDMKAIQKFIVMSQTYRQASSVTPEQLKIDPENKWLSRSPRLRLQAEFIRDVALQVSGLLVEKIGGPSVRPYMPDGVWDETSRYGDLRNYQADTNEGRYRRSMYTIWKRTAAPPTMLLFDAPNREICTVKRSRTNTPLQALSLLNEVTFIEAARGLAKRMITEGGASSADRIKFGFRWVTGRQPNDRELQVLESGLAADLEALQKHPEAIEGLLTSGKPLEAANLDRRELAAYSLAANVLLNLDEFVNRP